jgi:type II secretory pathway pseudopilin PulG
MRVPSKRRGRGFTLVEIMVSLVAGLFIAMAVIALSKTATNTFHEEVRAATVEASLRTASERLRNDLIRVAFMGTGNNWIDPKAARPVSGKAPGERYPDMQDLQGIRINFKGSVAASNPILAANKLMPDSVVIAGNLTTDDAYRMQWVPPGQAVGTGGCGGPQLQMKPDADAALQRLVGGANWGSLPAGTPGRLVNTAFTPMANKDFFARAIDDRGCPQYIQVCDSGFAGGVVYVNVRPSNDDQGLLTPNDTKDICGGNPLQTEFSVSPLSRVKWDIVPSNSPLFTAQTQASLAPDPAIVAGGIETAADKFVLVREQLATDGTIVNNPEIIAEYAVDMQFGTVVSLLPTKIPTIYDMDPQTVAAQNSTPLAHLTTLGTGGPQRVRAVRYRLSVRTALPDRRTTVSIFPTPNLYNQPYIVRYCTNANLGTCATWARVRTIVSEVPLINQARFDY